ncbi:MAG: hypothetical protein AAF962_14735 [Actinomycetota bacterium]
MPNRRSDPGGPAVPRFLAILLSCALLTAACSSDGDGAEVAADDATTDSAGTDAPQDGDGGGEVDAGDGATDDGGSADDDDAAEILGDPDLDVDDLPDEVAEALDDIDDVVSIGDCRSDVVGLAVTAPDGWQCRVLDQPAAGQDGFTLFTEGNQLNITIGTASPYGTPCELLNMCDQALDEPFSANFPDTRMIEVAGTVTIWGTHASEDAELIITKPSALTTDEIALISRVLDSAVVV